MTDKPLRARVSMLIDVSPVEIYRAFIDPKLLTRFWLSSASAPLQIDKPVHWDFMVKGASVETTAKRLDEGKGIAWQWSDGAFVEIDISPMPGGAAVTVIVTGFEGDIRKQAEAALDTTEGFAIVLCDLKTLLEGGNSAGLCRGKAKLIERRAKE